MAVVTQSLCRFSGLESNSLVYEEVDTYKQKWMTAIDSEIGDGFHIEDEEKTYEIPSDNVLNVKSKITKKEYKLEHDITEDCDMKEDQNNNEMKESAQCAYIDNTERLQFDYTKLKIKKPKKNAKKKHKYQGQTNRWKNVSLDEFGIDTSLLPWRSHNETDITEEMDVELKKFEEICSGNNKSAKDSENLVTNNMHCTQHSKRYHNLNSNNYISDELDAYSWSDNKLWDMADALLVGLNGSKKTSRLRHKKKWKIEKARKQIKSKNCRAVTNKVHGADYSVNHRVYKKIILFRLIFCHKFKASMKDIDKRWHNEGDGMTSRFRRVAGIKSTNTTNINGTCSDPIAEAIHRSKTTKQSSTHLLNTCNADNDLSADLVNVLMTIQNRDLTPEDYDLLLRLDDRVQVKTIPESAIMRFRVEIIEVSSDECCAICFDAYEVGQSRKYLPCGHYFHDICTVQWLKNSTICPIDGMVIDH